MSKNAVRVKMYFNQWAERNITEQVVDFEKRMNRFAHLCELAESEVYEVKVSTTEVGIVGTIIYQPWREGFNLSEAMSKS